MHAGDMVIGAHTPSLVITTICSPIKVICQVIIQQLANNLVLFYSCASVYTPCTPAWGWRVSLPPSINREASLELTGTNLNQMPFLYNQHLIFWGSHTWLVAWKSCVLKLKPINSKASILRNSLNGAWSQHMTMLSSCFCMTCPYPGLWRNVNKQWTQLLKSTKTCFYSFLWVIFVVRCMQGA